MPTGKATGGDMIYAETSVLASLVMQDSNSGRATKLTEKNIQPLLFNSLLKLEICNAIRLAVASDELTEERALESALQLKEIEYSGMWTVLEPEWERVMKRAVGFSKAHSSVLRTRSFDIVHVAAAIELGAKEFWSFDKRQRALALEVGLRVNA